MDTRPTDLGDDADLDAVMVRVREAAMAGGTRRDAQTAGDAKGADIDLVRIIDAQGEWNEHTSQSLAALVDGLRTLRDDWLEAHARLREDMDQLSALVSELQTGTDAAVTRARQPNGESKRARGARSSPRATRKRRSIKGGKRRS